MQSSALEGVFYLKPVFYVAVAFVLFFVLFGGKVVKAATAALDARIAGVKNALDEAARLRTEAQAMLADAQAQRREAIAQSQALLASARDEAQRLSVSMAADAEAAAGRRERMAMDRIAAAEKAVVSELRVAAVDIAAAATEQVLAATLTLEDDDALIDRAITAMPGALRAA